MRKLIVLISVLALILCLPGCSGILEGQYSASRDHEHSSVADSDDAQVTLEADDRAELMEAVSSLVAGGVERGVIRLAGYEGDMEADMAEACLAAGSDTAIGAYCVSFINYSLNRLVSMYEASVSIIYRHSLSEANNLPRCSGPESLMTIMLRTLTDRSDLVTVYVTGDGVTEADVTRAVEQAYYDNPNLILYIPTYTVASYPASGEERIMEISLTYPYATSTVETRRRNMNSRAEDIAATLEGSTVQERLTSLCRYFAANVTLDETIDSSSEQARRYTAMTAYGAIVQRGASEEGWALAVKVLCTAMGIDCTVVRGRHNNIDRCWDLVRLDSGDLYHLDVCRFDPEGAVFCNDAQMEALGYWWEAQEYQPASGQSLYGPDIDPLTKNDGEGGEDDEGGGNANEPGGGEAGGENSPGGGEDAPQPGGSGQTTPDKPEPGGGEPQPGGEPVTPETPPEEQDPETGGQGGDQEPDPGQAPSPEDPSGGTAEPDPGQTEPQPGGDTQPDANSPDREQ